MRFPCLLAFATFPLVLSASLASAEEPSAGEKAVNPEKILRSPEDVFRIQLRPINCQRGIRGGFGPAAPVHWRLRERRWLQGTTWRKPHPRNLKPRREAPQSTELLRR